MERGGFGVYDDRRNRELTAKEIEAERLFMNYHGELIRIECTPNADGVWVCVARHPRDLYLTSIKP